MSGLFRKLSGRRSGGPEGTEPQQGTTDATGTPSAEDSGHVSLLKDPAAETRVMRPDDTPHRPLTPEPPPDYTVFEPPPDPHAPAPFTAPPVQPPPPGYVPPPVEPVADLPAGLDPDELAAAPSTSARRSRLRRRISFLRAAREVLLRDLGGFVYEVHRTAHDIEHEAHRRLRETKLGRLTRLDAELHELELRLDDVRRQVLVREPGVGGECPHCGELFASDAHYCSNCGNPLTESAGRRLARAPVAAEPVPAAPPPEPVTAVDQPTQEIPPQDPEHPGGAPADFQWPRRETTPTSPAGEDAANAREGSEPPTAAADPVEGAETPATDDTLAAADQATAADTGAGSEPGDPETGGDGGERASDRGETPATDDTLAATDQAAAADTSETADPPATDEGAEATAPGETPAPASPGDPRTGTAEPPNVNGAHDAEANRDLRQAWNAHDDSIPVERRQ